MPTTDSYQLFVEYFSKNAFSEDEFINWGLNHIIFADKVVAEEEWKTIKNNWDNNTNLWIRNSGRNGQSSKLYTEFYKQFGKDINFDKTNNEMPTKTIQYITQKVKYDKSRHEKCTEKNASLEILRNYQVSHIWGHTKNPLLFVCPWNICFVPKMFDPFTGHEAKGPLVNKFQKKFIDKAKCLYCDLIRDYNDFLENEILRTGLIDKYINSVESDCKIGKITQRTFNDFKRNIIEEFQKL